MKSKLIKTFQEPVRRLMDPGYVDTETLQRESSRIIRHTRAQAQRLEERLNELTGSILHSRWIEHPDSLFSRKEVGHWLNWHGLTGEGVEVGVFKGEFSDELLDTWACTRLTSIDPWREFPSAEYVDSCNLPQDQHDKNHKLTQERLERFGARSRVLRATGEEGARECEDGSLDFVYLDAQHHYEAVKHDIEVWRPKVKSGGVLGGHDYLDGTVPSGVYGVKSAVDEFAASHSYNVIVTREPAWRSWFVRIA